MQGSSPFRSDILNGKTALITGGGSGIGFEITRQLGLHGAKVVISGRRKAVLEGACEALRRDGITDCHFVQADVRSYADCERMVEECLSHQGFGHRLDIVINCAAGNFLSTAEQLSSNGFKTVMEIDALGTFNMSRAACNALKDSIEPHHEQPSSSKVIVNISATLHYGATWYQAHASAAKAAVDSLTRSLALEWGGYGIRVNGVAPGPIQGTAGMTKLAPGSAGQLKAMIEERIPVGRMGQAWDIAMAVLFLVGPAGRFINGHTIVADGGEWMWRPPVIPREMVLQASKGIEAKSRSVGVVVGGTPSNGGTSGTSRL